MAAGAGGEGGAGARAELTLERGHTIVGRLVGSSREPLSGGVGLQWTEAEGVPHSVMQDLQAEATAAAACRGPDGPAAWLRRPTLHDRARP